MVRALVFLRPSSCCVEVLWYLNTSLDTARIFFATHYPEDFGLWLWEKDAFRRLTPNELHTFAETGLVSS